MYAIDTSTAVATRPAALAPGAAGYFTRGNPAAGQRATIVDPDWLNAFQQDLAAVIIAGGLTPTKGVDSQLLTAIQNMIGGAVSPLGNAPRLATGNGALTPGVYLTDTSGGSFTLTLPATPTTPSMITLIDATNSWGSHPLAVARSGHTIMGFASDLVCNIADQMLTIWWNGADWRLV